MVEFAILYLSVIFMKTQYLTWMVEPLIMNSMTALKLLKTTIFFYPGNRQVEQQEAVHEL